MNLAFLASYNGSSAQAITDACLNGDLIAAPILMISNNPASSALKWSENKGLKGFCLNNKTHPDSQELDLAIAQKLRDYKIDLVICSGYMKLVGPETIMVVEGKILNIHPALLPKYGGHGMYGRHVHQAVKDNRDSETGATIHLVNDEYDKGKIISQKKINVLETDNVDDIEKNVREIEPQFYIETLKKIINGDITL
ncbi:MAG: phosphoribosylglycinamide formyltransferase [Alphaproteobacteria bacterium]|nr:phosphoribosylglycinamide formyltransferase [Alphaproteobacteria bacterium]